MRQNTYYIKFKYFNHDSDCTAVINVGDGGVAPSGLYPALHDYALQEIRKTHKNVYWPNIALTEIAFLDSVEVAQDLVVSGIVFSTDKTKLSDGKTYLIRSSLDHAVIHCIARYDGGVLVDQDDGLPLEWDGSELQWAGPLD